MPLLNAPLSPAYARGLLVQGVMDLGTRSYPLDPAIIEAALLNLHCLECPTPQEEALSIALRLRQVLEDPEATGALVTADRILARRVALELKRWGVFVDDSAGEPLKHGAPFSYLLLLARLVNLPHPGGIELMSVLKHPLFGGNMGILERTRWIEHWESQIRRHGKTALEALYLELDILPQSPQSLGSHLKYLRQMGERLAMTPHGSGPQRLWQGVGGPESLKAYDTISESASLWGEMSPQEFYEFLEASIDSELLRLPYGSHPRLFIWGPMQAYGLKADLMIIGGLNEGSFPSLGSPDPWLSRPMTQSLGLPGPDEGIGKAAFHFCHGFASPSVLLTRSLKQGGTPTLPSRWWLRLETLLKAYGKEVPIAEDLLEWARRLDDPQNTILLDPPAPCPPVEARPRQLSVTQIETLMRDPYSVYARHILKLRPQDPLRTDPTHGDLGTLIHEILEKFMALPREAQTVEILVQEGIQAIEGLLTDPVQALFWKARFEKIARWIVDQNRTRSQDHHLEVSGALKIEGAGGPFTLTAKADRIDLGGLGDFGACIIDYKTGTPPTQKEIALGLSPQLPLEALILEQGGFEGIPETCVDGLEFWWLQGAQCEVKSVDPGSSHQAFQGLKSLIDHFDDPKTPYRSIPNPSRAPSYNDYAALSRIREWSRTQKRGRA